MSERQFGDRDGVVPRKKNKKESARERSQKKAKRD